MNDIIKEAVKDVILVYENVVLRADRYCPVPNPNTINFWRHVRGVLIAKTLDAPESERVKVRAQLDQMLEDAEDPVKLFGLMEQAYDHTISLCPTFWAAVNIHHGIIRQPR